MFMLQWPIFLNSIIVFTWLLDYCHWNNGKKEKQIWDYIVSESGINSNKLLYCKFTSEGYWIVDSYDLIIMSAMVPL